jgi:hypothetical protein
LVGLLFALLLPTLAGLLILLAGFLSGLRIALLLTTLARLVLVLLLVGIVHFDNSKGDIALQPLRVLLPPSDIWDAKLDLRVYFFLGAIIEALRVDIAQHKATNIAVNSQSLSCD